MIQEICAEADYWVRIYEENCPHRQYKIGLSTTSSHSAHVHISQKVKRYPPFDLCIISKSPVIRLTCLLTCDIIIL